VLEADSRRPGTFLATDVAFLQAAANLLGVAIERNRRETDLERALLIREADHRIRDRMGLHWLGMRSGHRVAAGSLREEAANAKIRSPIPRFSEARRPLCCRAQHAS
jgi:GAF domain-containing protein